MRIEEISSPDLIVESLRSSSCTDALRQMVERIAEKRGFNQGQVEEFLSEVLRRHEKTPCGLGRGLAFPNTRTDSVSEPCLAVGRSNRGLDCGAKDGGLAHVVLLYIGRATPSEAERAMLGRLSKALANSAFSERLLSSDGPRELWETLASIDQDTAAGLRGGRV